MTRTRANKHHALIQVTKKRLYQQGFHMTRLAEIAKEANMPLGNIYYHFETKAELGEAALKLMLFEKKTFLASLNKESSPKMRLHKLLEQIKQESELIAKQGCRIGTLCQELARERGTLHNLAAELMMNMLLWIEAQFSALGLIEEASDLSLALVQRLQGACLLGYAFRDPALIVRQMTFLQMFVTERIAEGK